MAGRVFTGFQLWSLPSPRVLWCWPVCCGLLGCVVYHTAAIFKCDNLISQLVELAHFLQFNHHGGVVYAFWLANFFENIFCCLTHSFYKLLYNFQVGIHLLTTASIPSKARAILSPSGKPLYSLLCHIPNHSPAIARKPKNQMPIPVSNPAIPTTLA